MTDVVDMKKFITDSYSQLGFFCDSEGSGFVKVALPMSVCDFEQIAHEIKEKGGSIEMNGNMNMTVWVGKRPTPAISSVPLMVGLVLVLIVAYSWTHIRNTMEAMGIML